VDNVEANREGHLSDAQVGAMRRVERASALVGVAALVAAAGSAGVALLVQGRGPAFYLFGAVAIIFAGGAAAAFWNYSVVRRDREFEIVETFEGTVEAAGQRWRLGEVVVTGDGVEAGRRYRVWFLRGSHRLLSAEPLGGNPGRPRKVR
jgi:hypothetical protein